MLRHTISRSVSRSMLLLAITLFTALQSAPANAEPASPRVLTPNGRIRELLLSPDSAYAVYFIEAPTSDGSMQLMSVPLHGGAPVELLNAPAVGGVSRFLITPDGAAVIYARATGVFRVPIGGGASVQLSAQLPDGLAVNSFDLSRDGAYVVYSVTRSLGSAEQSDIFSVPAVGGVAVRLNAPLGSSERTQDAVISPDSSRVVYELWQGSAPSETSFSLLSVPLTGGTSVPLSRPFPGGSLPWQISPDSQFVVYPRGLDDANSMLGGLYRVPLTGGTPVPLATPAERSVSFRFEITTDSTRVVFIAGTVESPAKELYSMPLAGGSFVQLSPTLAADGAIRRIRLSPDGTRVAYLADTGPFTPNELYSVPTTGGTAVKLNGALLGTSSVGDSIIWSPDSRRVAFLAVPSTASDNKPWLWSAPADGGAPAVVLAEPAQSSVLYSEVHMTPDSRWVLFGSRRPTTASEYVIFDLLAAPIAGGFAPVRLTSDTTVAAWSIFDPRNRFPSTADSRQVVFRKAANPPFGDGPRALAIADLVVPGHSVARVGTQGGTLASPNGLVTVQFGPGAVSADTTVEYEPLLAPEPALPAGQTALRAFALTARDGRGRVVTQFGAPLTLTVNYSDAELAPAGLDETALNIVFWNGAAWAPLLPCAGCRVDTSANRVTLTLDHFTRFALVGGVAVMPLPGTKVFLPLTGGN